MGSSKHQGVLEHTVSNILLDKKSGDSKTNLNTMLYHQWGCPCLLGKYAEAYMNMGATSARSDQRSSIIWREV